MGCSENLAAKYGEYLVCINYQIIYSIILSLRIISFTSNISNNEKILQNKNQRISTTRVQVRKLLVATHRFVSSEPTSCELGTASKVSKCGVFSGPYFPVNSVYLRIQSECGKIRIRKNSVFGHFSGSWESKNWGLWV